MLSWNSPQINMLESPQTLRMIMAADGRWKRSRCEKHSFAYHRAWGPSNILFKIKPRSFRQPPDSSYLCIQLGSEPTFSVEIGCYERSTALCF